jgi:hypothetical protein
MLTIMARTSSAGSTKSGQGRRQQKPREGTLLREIYDLFKANEGLPIELNVASKFRGNCCAASEQLQSIYGLDIRCLYPKCGHRKVSIWVLAGEWFGMDYVDYIARRL